MSLLGCGRRAYVVGPSTSTIELNVGGHQGRESKDGKGSTQSQEGKKHTLDGTNTRPCLRCRHRLRPSTPTAVPVSAPFSFLVTLTEPASCGSMGSPRLLTSTQTHSSVSARSCCLPLHRHPHHIGRPIPEPSSRLGISRCWGRCRNGAGDDMMIGLLL